MLLTRQGISLIDVIDLLGIFVQITVRLSLGSHPACRHADRTISSSMRIDVWRVVSEDSDNFGSWLFMIHGFGDLDDLDQPTRREVSAYSHQIHAFRKLQEVALLGSSQRIPIKERNNGLHQFSPSSNTVPIHMFFVVVVSLVDIDIANTKELHEQVETFDA
jgi:hypothetical protein